ncbi:hypothetical protein WJ972_08045 [Achromobacter insuavis]
MMAPKPETVPLAAALTLPVRVTPAPPPLPPITRVPPLTSTPPGKAAEPSNTCVLPGATVRSAAIAAPQEVLNATVAVSHLWVPYFKTGVLFVSAHGPDAIQNRQRKSCFRLLKYSVWIGVGGGKRTQFIPAFCKLKNCLKDTIRDAGFPHFGYQPVVFIGVLDTVHIINMA